MEGKRATADNETSKQSNTYTANQFNDVEIVSTFVLCHRLFPYIEYLLLEMLDQAKIS